MRPAAAALWLLVAFYSCTQRPCSAPQVLPGGSELWQGQAVPYCDDDPPPQSLRFQLLVDTSGSMAGFHGSFTHLQEWVQQSLSRFLRGGVAQEVQTCGFRMAGQQSEFQCGSAINLAKLQPKGETALHLAIEKASATDLTLILTDGVAASGAEGSSACAQGVDAACVARALRAAVQPRPGEAQDHLAGIWVVPIALMFDGKLYTELLASPKELNIDDALAKVKEDTGGVAAIADVGHDAVRRLMFRYSGPRVLVALLLSRDIATGRAFAAELAAGSDTAGIRKISSLKEYQNGRGVLPPIEVFPGFSRTFSARSASIVENRGKKERCGTMDVRFQGGSIRTVCPATEGNSAVVKVGLASQAVKLSCPVFNVLPVMQELTLEKGPVTAHRWEVAQIDGNENQLEFRAAIRCGARKGRQEVMVTASADFAATQDCLNSQDCKQGSAIRAISTQEPHLYPHRIFSLGSALQLFYRDLKGVAPKFPLLNLAIEEGG